MVAITSSPSFVKAIQKCDAPMKEKVTKLIKKIIANPSISKPLKYTRFERSLRIKPFRLIYTFKEKEDILYLLKLEHRKSVYD